MRPQVKVTSTRDSWIDWIMSGEHESVGDSNSVFFSTSGWSSPIDAVSKHKLLLTGDLGLMYGCTIILDSYQQDEGERLLNLVSEVIEDHG